MYSQKFTIRHTFQNFAEPTDKTSDLVEHFGASWRIVIRKSENTCRLGLYCEKKPDDEDPSAIDAGYDMYLINGQRRKKVEKRDGASEHPYRQSAEHKFKNKRGTAFHHIIDWSDVIKKHVIDGSVTVECVALFNVVKGKKKPCFKEPRKNLTDVALVVEGQKFHVSKVVLSTFSDVFAAMFNGQYQEASMSEVALKEVDPQVFQMLLEVIHKENDCIDEDTVEDILQVARQFQVRVVAKRCAEFLDHEETVDKELKKRLVETYNLEDLDYI